MSDRLQEIKKRIDTWQRQKDIGTEGWWDGVRHYEPLLCADIRWLLMEVERLQKMGAGQEPVIEVRGNDGSVWVRIDGLIAPRSGDKP